jgi:hypothetical protein
MALDRLPTTMDVDVAHPVLILMAKQRKRLRR